MCGGLVCMQMCVCVWFYSHPSWGQHSWEQSNATVSELGCKAVCPLHSSALGPIMPSPTAGSTGLWDCAAMAVRFTFSHSVFYIFFPLWRWRATFPGVRCLGGALGLKGDYTITMAHTRNAGSKSASRCQLNSQLWLHILQRVPWSQLPHSTRTLFLCKDYSLSAAVWQSAGSVVYLVSYLHC